MKLEENVRKRKYKNEHSASGFLKDLYRSQ